MAKYVIEISKTAEKQLKKINKKDQKKIANAILMLGSNPFLNNTTKLKGYDDVFRYRVGSYRIIYTVENKKLVIIILKLGHRKDIYR